jgi:hypothetical protein
MGIVATYILIIGGFVVICMGLGDSGFVAGIILIGMSFIVYYLSEILDQLKKFNKKHKNNIDQ